MQEIYLHEKQSLTKANRTLSNTLHKFIYHIEVKRGKREKRKKLIT